MLIKQLTDKHGFGIRIRRPVYGHSDHFMGDNEDIKLGSVERIVTQQLSNNQFIVTDPDKPDFEFLIIDGPQRADWEIVK